MYVRICKFSQLSDDDLARLEGMVNEEDSWMQDLLDGVLDEDRTDDLLVARIWEHHRLANDIPMSPLGWATAHVTLLKHWMNKHPEACNEYSIFVKPEHRRKGVAKKLILELRRAMPYENEDVSFPTDEVGEAFYRACGIIPITEEDIDARVWVELSPLVVDHDEEDDEQEVCFIPSFTVVESEEA